MNEDNWKSKKQSCVNILLNVVGINTATARYSHCQAQPPPENMITLPTLTHMYKEQSLVQQWLCSMGTSTVQFGSCPQLSHRYHQIWIWFFQHDSIQCCNCCFMIYLIYLWFKMCNVYLSSLNIVPIFRLNVHQKAIIYRNTLVLIFSS